MRGDIITPYVAVFFSSSHWIEREREKITLCPRVVRIQNFGYTQLLQSYVTSSPPPPRTGSYQSVSLTYTYRIHPESATHLSEDLRPCRHMSGPSTHRILGKIVDLGQENRVIRSILRFPERGPTTGHRLTPITEAHTTPKFPKSVQITHGGRSPLWAVRVSPSIPISPTLRPHTHYTRVMWRRCGMIRCDCGAIR